MAVEYDFRGRKRKKRVLKRLLKNTIGTIGMIIAFMIMIVTVSQLETDCIETGQFILNLIFALLLVGGSYVLTDRR